MKKIEFEMHRFFVSVALVFGVTILCVYSKSTTSFDNYKIVDNIRQLVDPNIFHQSKHNANSRLSSNSKTSSGVKTSLTSESDKSVKLAQSKLTANSENDKNSVKRDVKKLDEFIPSKMYTESFKSANGKRDLMPSEDLPYDDTSSASKRTTPHKIALDGTPLSDTHSSTFLISDNGDEDTLDEDEKYNVMPKRIEKDFIKAVDKEVKKRFVESFSKFMDANVAKETKKVNPANTSEKVKSLKVCGIHYKLMHSLLLIFTHNSYLHN